MKSSTIVSGGNPTDEGKGFFRKGIKAVKAVGINLLEMSTNANLARDLLQRSKPDDSFVIELKKAKQYITLLDAGSSVVHEEPLTIEAAYTLIHTGNGKIVPKYLEKFSLKPEDYINIAMEMTGSMQRVDYISALAENRMKFEEKGVDFNDIFSRKIRDLGSSLHYRNADRFRKIFEEHATSDYGENVLAPSPGEKVSLINESELNGPAKTALLSIEKDGVEIRLKSDKKYHFVAKNGKRLHFAPLSESELKSMYLSEDGRIGCLEREGQFVYVPKLFVLKGWSSN